MTSVDVCIPTKNGKDIIGKSLEKLLYSITQAGLEINNVLVINSNKYHSSIVTGWLREICDQYDTELTEWWEQLSLADARENLIKEVETDWFVFLDDDALVSEAYISWLWDWTACDRVGAVRGRKARFVERHATDWLKQRVRRAGVHCLLVRTDAVSDLSYPEDITGVYEDEYMRHHIETEYRFVYEPLATFTHENQNRHPPGWEEGKLAGKYGYEPFYMEALNVPYSVVVGRNPWPHTKRMLGWLYGRYAL